MDYFNDLYRLIVHNEIFRELPNSALRELCNFMKPEHFPIGTTILKKNTIGNWMYIIRSGQVKVHDESNTITHLEAGEIIGELSLLKSEVRSMSVTATQDTLTYSITHNDFFKIAEKYPKVLRGIIGVLVDRLRHQTAETLKAFEIREKRLTELVEERTKDLHLKNLELERTQKYKEQFLANMSHEIRTPMTAIIGFTNLVLESPLNEKQRKQLTNVQKSSAVLLKIINEILDYSKIEAGKMTLENIFFSINSVVNQVIDTLKQKANDKGIELYSNFKTSVSEAVIGDALRLNQILMNLVGNAIKFTEKGSVAIEITQTPQGSVLFKVIDTGIGIPADKINDVFKGFTQAHTSDSRKYGGSGLGLAISKQLVALMGGHLQLESIMDRGSVFSFELSFPKGTLEDIKNQDAPELFDAKHLDGLSILLVDDNEINRIVCHDTLLSKANVSIKEATNGKEAIEQLNNNNFDIILMDVQMPEMDGCEATKYIRSNFKSPKKDIPIIAITASVIRSDLDKCRDAGMNDYIPKPFRQDQLFNTISKNLGFKIEKSEKTNPTQEHLKTSEKVQHQNSNAENLPDLSYLKDFCANNPDKILKYIDMYLEATPNLIMTLNIALSENNYQEIATQVHSFKLKFVMMGMQKAKELGLSIEIDCRTDTPDISIITNKTNELIKLIVISQIELTKTKETLLTRK
ncbi:MAG TPA: ATP-binding protein [Edaphocola sp.]|nr:ATP-binding protein [Edaphocola sp.]